jgi:hypothetical protein
VGQRRDAAARAAIPAALETTLAQHGPKAVIGNKGFARFVRVVQGAVTIDRQRIAADARLDGEFVLRTSTALSPAEVAQAYKSLWRLERTFRETRSTLQVRPLYHHADDPTVGHIVACFLALRLEVDLQRRLDTQGCTASWRDLMRDLMRDLEQMQGVMAGRGRTHWRWRAVAPSRPARGLGRHGSGSDITRHLSSASC